jgi:hypothetical protein
MATCARALTADEQQLANVVLDNYGNRWSLVGQQLQVISAASGEATLPVETPLPRPGFVVADDHGFVWVGAAAPPALCFCNPRATLDTETPDGSPQQPGAPSAWVAVLGLGRILLSLIVLL